MARYQDTDGERSEVEQHNINETADKCRVQTKIKRGTGTRDQDTHNIKVRGETPGAVASNLAAIIRELESRNVFTDTRRLGNEANDE